MTNFIPIFPLEIVVYPGEKCNLHVFEERYKQLIGECFKNKKPFGLPSVIKNKISENGTLMEVSSIVKKYSDGRMDITTTGLSVYRILEVIDSIPAKLYSGAIVKHLNNDENGKSKHIQKIISGIRELHRILHVDKKFSKPDEELKGLVYSLTARQRDPNKVWYKNPLWLGIVVLVLTLILNIIFF